jgi:hypothetical protein
MKDCGPITDVEFRASPLTVFRLARELDHFLYFTGRFLDSGKKAFSGSRGWAGDLALYKEPVKVLDLMNTIMDNFYAHHYPLVLADVGSCLEEMAWWLDLKRVPKAEYRDYMYVQ